MARSTKESGGYAYRDVGTTLTREGNTESSNYTSPQRNSRNRVPAIVTLALWRLRQTWRLLAITGLGIVAAVMLVSAVPLYSNVAMTAGLRSVITSSDQSADIVVQSMSQQISSSIISSATSQLDQDFQHNLGPYLAPRQFSIQTQVLPIIKRFPECLPPDIYCNQVRIFSFSMKSSASHLRLIAGRVPLTSSNDLEVALTSESAQRLGVTVGSVLTTTIDFDSGPVRVAERDFNQIASILTWEQSIIYITALLLGIFFGALLSLLALPVLIFTSAASSGAGSDISSGVFFVVQNVPPIQVIIPISLAIVLGVLIAICIVALGMMIRVVSQPSIGSTLRLNED